MNLVKLNSKRFFLLLSFIFLTRLFFIFGNFDSYQGYSIGQMLLPIFTGLRFDLAATCILIIPILLLSFSLEYFKKGQWIVDKAYLLIGSMGILLGCIDIDLFKFTGRKFTSSVMDMMAEAGTHGTELVQEHYMLATMSVILILIFIFISTKLIKQNLANNSYIKNTAVLILMLGVSFVGVRGGLQNRTLTSKDAFAFNDYLLGNIALNSTYSLIRSIGKSKIKKLNYFTSDQAAIDLIEQNYPRQKPLAGTKGQNVVILMIEGFSSEYMGAIKGGELTPFLDNLSSKSLFFPNNFANGLRSMHAQPAIFASLPSLIGQTLYKSSFQTNKFYTLPQILKEQGYTNHYYHGSDRGIFGFDSYALSIGFDRYFAKEDYDGPTQDFDGNWGIYDRPYLNYAVKEISKIKEPFLSTVFTLSSHHPFNLEPAYKGKLPTGPQPVQELIAYVDLGLKSFFEKAAKESWYKNTLFVITGDHGFSIQLDQGYQHFIGKFRVPLLFFHPTIDLKAKYEDETRITQHTDIMPTVLDFLGIKTPWKQLMGRSLLQKNNGVAINSFTGYHYLVKDKQAVLFNGKSAEFFNVSSNLEKLEKTSPDEALLAELKAYLQYYMNGLIKNDLYIE